MEKNTEYSNKYTKILLENYGIPTRDPIYYKLRTILRKYYNSEKGIIEGPNVDDIIKFVDKIERRKGLATDKDVFVDMIDYFDYVSLYCDNTPVKIIDRFTKDEQIYLMYAYILLFVSKVKSGELLAYILDDYILLIEEKKLNK
jgi:hypothetical protein